MSHKFICKYILQMHMKPEVEINLQLRLQMHPANTSGNAFANLCTIGVLQTCLANASANAYTNLSANARDKVQVHLQPML